MTRQRKFPFSHIKTICFSLAVAIIGCSGKAMASQNAGQYRDSATLMHLANGVGDVRWTTYLKLVNNYGITKADVNWFMNSIALLSEYPTLIDPVIIYFQKHRTKLPMEFRWTIAAAELHRGKVTDDTLLDAEFGIRAISPGLVFKFGRLTSEVSLEVPYLLNYETNGDTTKATKAFDFFSTQTLLFFFRALHKAPHFDSTIFQKDIHERRRKDWVTLLVTISKQTTFDQTMAALLDLSYPEIRRFKNPEYKQRFMLELVQMIMNFGMRYGDHGFNSYLNVSHYLEGEYKQQDYTLRTLIKTWLLEDLEFSSLHYDLFLRLEILTLEDFLKMNLTAENVKYLERSLLFPNKDSSPQAYVVNALIWLKRYGHTSSPISNRVSNELTQIIFAARPGNQNSVRIGSDAIHYGHVFSADYWRYVKAFYEVTAPPHKLDSKAVDLIKKSPHIRTAEINEDQWKLNELARYRHIRDHSSPREFMIYIKREFIDRPPSDLKERIFLGRVFQLYGDPALAVELSNLLKAKARPSFALFNKAGKIQEAWNKNHGELVHLVFSVNPRDPELVAYLTDLYVNHPVSGAVSGQDALRMIEEIGIPNQEVKTEILRNLQYITAGDTSGAFRALIRLFPEEGTKIVEIVYRHYKEPQAKLKPILEQLVERSFENPGILTSVREGIVNQPRSAASNALYQGLKLDLWLERQLVTKFQNQHIKSCAMIWRNP